MKKDFSSNAEKNTKPKGFKKITRIFNKSSRKTLGGIFKQTLKDLRKPQEILLLLGGTFIPGGWVGYAAYRLAKYKLTKPANDDANSPKAQKPAKKKTVPKPPQK